MLTHDERDVGRIASARTYRGPESGAQTFLVALAERVAAVAVRVNWLGGSLVWFDQGGDSVAGVSADRPLLQALITSWAEAARRASSTRLVMEISERD